MSHGGDIFEKNIVFDYSVSINPMGTPARVTDAIKESLEHISEYPDLKQRRLRKALSELEGCKPEEVLGGNGSSGLFHAIVQMIRPETALLISPCFSGYEYALAAEGNCRVFRYPEEEICSLPGKIDASADLLIIANPNNPTGRNIDFRTMIEIAEKCEETGTCLIADECFLSLSEHKESLSYFVRRFRKMFVVKAFTKTFAIPGIRIGYVVSSEENIKKLSMHLPEWSLSVPALEAGIACAGIMKEKDYLKNSCLMIKNERSYLERSLSEFGFEIVPSDTCFILFRAGEDLYGKLLERGLLIRDCSDFTGLEKGFFRVSVKNHEANQFLISALRDIIGY